jgi:translation initiation factor IF-2
MLNSRSRRLTIALAAGALTVFGATGAFAAGDSGPGESPSSTVPAAEEGGNPICQGTPVALQSTPLCAPEDGKEGPEQGGGGDAQPSDESNPLCSGTPLSATPICAAPSEPPGEGGGGGGGDTGPGGGSGGGSPSAVPADEGGGANPVCILMPTDPSCQPSQGPGGGEGGGGDTQPSPGGPGGGGSGPSA